MLQILLQNAIAILLQNATKVYSKCVRFLLQSAAVSLKIATVIIKCVHCITKCVVITKCVSSIQLGSIRAFFLLGYFSVWEY